MSLFIYGLRIDNLTPEKLFQTITNRLESKTKTNIAKINAEFLNHSINDGDILKILNSFDINLVDGVGVLWASYILDHTKNDHWLKKFIKTWASALLLPFTPKDKLYKFIPEKFAGIDLTRRFLEFANQYHLAIGIITSREPQELKKKISGKYEDIKQINIYSGFFDKSKESELISRINKDNNVILFVAMGFPKQEKFIINNYQILNTIINIGEGGSFDYQEFGGKNPRAPHFLRSIHLEWLWRLILQPSRIRRQLSILRLILHASLH